MGRHIRVPVLGFLLVSIACGNHEDEIKSSSGRLALTNASGDKEASALLAQLRTKHIKKVVLPSALDGQWYRESVRETYETALPESNSVAISPQSSNAMGTVAAFTVTPRSTPESRNGYAEVTMPQRAIGYFEVKGSRNLGIRARLRNAGNAEGRVSGDYVVYANAYGEGNHVLHRAGVDGLEDFISFDRRPAAPVVTYDIELGPAVSGLRLVADTLELLSTDGYPLLRVSPPSLVDAQGVTHSAALALTGCAFDADPRVPWNRAVTPPSAKECQLRVQWDDTNVAYPALLDPTWSTTGSMAVARSSHTVSALPNGDVLAVGGSSGGAGLASAEIYSRENGVWAATGSMLSPRSAHSANELLDGSVVVLGGYSSDPSSSETYDPATGLWTAAGVMPSARAAHASITLSDGRVLATGGINPSNNFSYDALVALYEPATRTWSPSATMASSRALHSLQALADGRILAIGGSPSGGVASASCEIYDPSTNVWTATGSMATARYGSATATTQAGLIFVGGGYGGGFLSSVETYDPSTGTWTTRTPMSQARNGASATVAPGGRIIVAGGWSGTTFWNTTQIFDPTSMSWATGPTMLSPRGGHGAIAHDGVLLAVGGRQGSTSYLATAEVISLAPPSDAGRNVHGQRQRNRVRSELAEHDAGMAAIVHEPRCARYE